MKLFRRLDVLSFIQPSTCLSVKQLFVLSTYLSSSGKASWGRELQVWAFNTRRECGYCAFGHIKSFTVNLSSRVRVTLFIQRYLWSVVLHILYSSIKRSERDAETSFRNVNSIFIPVNVHAFSVTYCHRLPKRFGGIALFDIFVPLH